MPTLNASTTAVFSATGLSAETIYDVIVSLIGTAVNFGLFLVQTYWPFMLVLGFIGLLIGIAKKYMGATR